MEIQLLAEQDYRENRAEHRNDRIEEARNVGSHDRHCAIPADVGDDRRKDGEISYRDHGFRRYDHRTAQRDLPEIERKREYGACGNRDENERQRLNRWAPFQQNRVDRPEQGAGQEEEIARLSLNPGDLLLLAGALLS